MLFWIVEMLKELEVDFDSRLKSGGRHIFTDNIQKIYFITKLIFVYRGKQFVGGYIIEIGSGF